MQRDNRSPSSDIDRGRTSGDDFDQQGSWSATLPTTEHYYFHGGARTTQIYRRPDCDDSEQIAHPQFVEDHRSRFTSPTYSGTSAGGPPSVDSSRSDCNSSPRLKTETGGHWCSQSPTPLLENMPLPHGGYAPGSQYTASLHACVAMHEVHPQADEPDDTPTSSLGRGVAYPYPHLHPLTYYDGFVPDDGQAGLPPDIEPAYGSREQNREMLSHPGEGGRPANFRHRRTLSATTDRTTTGRIRRPPYSRHGSSNQPSTRSRSSSSRAAPASVFPCLFVVYGCDRTFTSKNEWKRHIQTQHVQLEYWRCIQCFKGPSSEQDKDFNRKDLFTQHILRMHSTQSEQSSTRGGKVKSDTQKRYEDMEAERCRRTLRQPPNDSRCIVCDQTFSGPGSWEQCIDHIGKHLDTAAKDGLADMLNPRNWRQDYALQQYLQREDILTIDTQGSLRLS
ncbi:hypothetical protein CB0940_00032 [Cercospora beticola]|uniref:C2H2-type domain-containing protein n=1 Tax=Cercospora beticola TaxID=122368 RepID=A0A2G5I7L9_CERBT|nr:hypothetical protein CB0940_00032 [Cercospora beticola]PIB00780.1 hypothetical protein CB0940_00032 [Cercospora beticola]WPA95434.1 hypothetical protein RHO25_000033 [Cercospora beticola]